MGFEMPGVHLVELKAIDRHFFGFAHTLESYYEA